MGSYSVTDERFLEPEFTLVDGITIPPVIKEFFSTVQIDSEKNRWTSTCKHCRTSISDTYKTTSNFLKHTKKKHLLIFNEWKRTYEERTNEKSQPRIIDVFSPDGEKCKILFEP